MNTNLKIYILSGDIQTGKSEALMQWIEGKSCAGFITPTVDGKKMFYDILSKTYHDYEMQAASQHTISVGKYYLNKETFQLAKEIFSASSNESAHEQNEKHEWFVMDEIGKLELEGKGHSDLLKQAFETWKANILLVVREALVDEVKLHFGIKNNVNIIDKISLLT